MYTQLSGLWIYSCPCGLNARSMQERLMTLQAMATWRGFVRIRRLFVLSGSNTMFRKPAETPPWRTAGTTAANNGSTIGVFGPDAGVSLSIRSPACRQAPLRVASCRSFPGCSAGVFGPGVGVSQGTRSLACRQAPLRVASCGSFAGSSTGVFVPGAGASLGFAPPARRQAPLRVASCGFLAGTSAGVFGPGVGVASGLRPPACRQSPLRAVSCGSVFGGPGAIRPGVPSTCGHISTWWSQVPGGLLCPSGHGGPSLAAGAQGSPWRPGLAAGGGLARGGPLGPSFSDRLLSFASYANGCLMFSGSRSGGLPLWFPMPRASARRRVGPYQPGQSPSAPSWWNALPWSLRSALADEGVDVSMFGVVSWERLRLHLQDSSCKDHLPVIECAFRCALPESNISNEEAPAFIQRLLRHTNADRLFPTELHSAVGVAAPVGRSLAGPTPTQEIHLLSSLRSSGVQIGEVLDNVAAARARASLAPRSMTSYASNCRMIEWACAELGAAPVPSSLQLITRIAAIINNPGSLRAWLAAWRDWHHFSALRVGGRS